MLKILFLNIFFIGCTYKQPILSQSATIVFITPILKIYDKGFITYYDNYIHLQVFNISRVVLNLKIYKDKICQNDFKCLSSKKFNEKYLIKDYKDNFIYNLFKNDIVYFKDKKNKILIKIKKD
jgi:hypothetical protein